MKYDKKSFCAGIAVGTQLKGWASAGKSEPAGEGGIIVVGNAAILGTGPEVVYMEAGQIPMNDNSFILSGMPEIIFEMRTEE